VGWRKGGLFSDKGWRTREDFRAGLEHDHYCVDLVWNGKGSGRHDTLERLWGVRRS